MVKAYLFLDNQFGNLNNNPRFHK